jgi:hypothetical protein
MGRISGQPQVKLRAYHAVSHKKFEHWITIHWNTISGICKTAASGRAAVVSGLKHSSEEECSMGGGGRKSPTGNSSSGVRGIQGRRRTWSDRRQWRRGWSAVMSSGAASQLGAAAKHLPVENDDRSPVRGSQGHECRL